MNYATTKVARGEHARWEEGLLQGWGRCLEHEPESLERLRMSDLSMDGLFVVVGV